MSLEYMYGWVTCKEITVNDCDNMIIYIYTVISACFSQLFNGIYMNIYLILGNVPLTYI